MRDLASTRSRGSSVPTFMGMLAPSRRSTCPAAPFPHRPLTAAAWTLFLRRENAVKSKTAMQISFSKSFAIPRHSLHHLLARGSRPCEAAVHCQARDRCACCACASARRCASIIVVPASCCRAGDVRCTFAPPRKRMPSSGSLPSLPPQKGHCPAPRLKRRRTHP